LKVGGFTQVLICALGFLVQLKKKAKKKKAKSLKIHAYLIFNENWKMF
jgi:uncharacterized protein with PQ loop repeat